MDGKSLLRTPSQRSAWVPNEKRTLEEGRVSRCVLLAGRQPWNIPVANASLIEGRRMRQRPSVAHDSGATSSAQYQYTGVTKHVREGSAHQATCIEQAEEQDADDERVIELRTLGGANNARLPCDLAIFYDEDGRPDCSRAKGRSASRQFMGNDENSRTVK